MVISDEKDTNSNFVKRLWRFKNNKTAVLGTLVLGIFYFFAIFSDFISPYDPTQETKYMNVPPQKIHFLNDGEFTRPYIFGIKSKRDPKTLRKFWVEDKKIFHEIYFFIEAKYNYKFWGLFSMKTKLIGLKKNNTLSRKGN